MAANLPEMMLDLLPSIMHPCAGVIPCHVQVCVYHHVCTCCLLKPNTIKNVTGLTVFWCHTNTLDDNIVI